MRYNPGVKRVLSLVEAAEFLGQSPVNVRLRVEQGLLKPLAGRGGRDTAMLARAGELYFDREDLLKQWSALMMFDRDMREEIRYLVAVVNDLSVAVREVLNKVQTPDHLTLRAAADYLGVHRVTLQRRIDPVAGCMRLRGCCVVPIKKVEGKWLVRLADLKKVV